MSNKEKFAFHQLIKYALLPCCMVAVIVVHFYNTKHGLSSWKGGAFGMYSTYHPEESQFYINDIDYLDSIRTNKQQMFYLRSYLYYSDKNNLETLIKSLNHPSDTLHIQVWQPHLDCKTSTYSRTLKYEYNYIQSRR